MTDPLSFCEKLVPTTVRSHFLDEATYPISTMARLSGELGEAKVLAMLNVLVTDTVLFFQVGKMMGEAQIKETVGLIWKRYKHLKPEDFQLCFEELKLGVYGKIYDRLDGNIILDALGRYDARRDLEVELIREGQNGEFKKGLPLPEILSEAQQLEKDELFKANIQKLRETLAANKIAKEKEKQPAVETERKIDPMALLHQRWLKQFTDLSLKQQLRRGIRMVMKYGRMLDANEYLEYKQQQYITFNKLK